ncbi:MAG: heme-binding domain-containing protein [Bacteroidales bacterium]|jgi:hypothetical protein|nr:heme-binding domain-containing protein [Bacteroidales bacterium]MCK9447514.1 heme-binding domain-containing protein [Bacteroidales bacterium]MDD3700612.1 heme-binding domain-containing protein [Bacteroidales bacterium]MDY0368265.1 heme-binding domain-containing protein [Bacteroidales bacterium]
MKKYIVIISILVLFGLAQFIRPERNQQTIPSRYDIFHLTDTPAQIVSSIRTACYNCHSNSTTYPWYASISPVSWLIDRHIIEAKSELNFSEWILYSKEEQETLLLELIEVLEKSKMPPKPYLWLHAEAKFDQATTDMIIHWARDKKQQVQLN